MLLQMWEVWSLSPGIYWSPGVGDESVPPPQTTNCLLKSNYLSQTTSDFSNVNFSQLFICVRKLMAGTSDCRKILCNSLPLYLLFYKKLNRARQACSWPGIPSRRLLCVTKHSQSTPLLSSPLSSSLGGLSGLWAWEDGAALLDINSNTYYL